MAVIFVFGLLLPSYMSKKKASEAPTEQGEDVEKGQKKGEKAADHQPGSEGQGEGDHQPGSEGGSEGEGEEGEAGEAEEGQGPAKPELPDYPEEKVKLETPHVKAVFSTRGGTLVRYELLDHHYYLEKEKKNQDLVSQLPETGARLNQLLFRAESAKAPVPDNLAYRVLKQTDDTAVFVSEVGPWRIKRWTRIFDDYRLNVATTITNIGDEPAAIKPFFEIQSYKEQKKAKGILGWLNPSRDIPGGLCNLAGETEHKDIGKLQKEKLTRAGEILFTAVDELYFMSSLIPVKGKKKAGGDAALAADQAASFGCTVSVDENKVIRAQLFRAESNLAPGESTTLRAISYMGPKEYNRLSDFGYMLKTAINFGWFGSLSIFFLATLKTLYGWVGNWGLAIILLTLVIKLILLPLTHWSYVSMRNMAAVKPLIDEINKKFSAPEDREKKNQAMLELYKTHKINPMMGCFPMLLQMPIWISLYSMLARSVELYHTPFFLWITDLSQRDPYFILPVVLGGSMFVQQKLTPTTADSQQAKMLMYFMPVMFTGFMLFLPAGLNLYILVSTVLTILQQKLLYKPKVATTVDKKVQLMADLDQKELSNLKKDKSRKSKDGKRN
jgi:YidC/Oxa1 family membrane protein insertase